MAEISKEDTGIKHIIIIPDGDRRWAKERGLPVWEGHRRGTENITAMLEVCRDRNIPFLTMWGFSTENWKRPQDEIDHLFEYVLLGLKKQLKEAKKNGVRFRHIGRKERLPKDLLQQILVAEEETKHFANWNFTAALDYGGQDEIVRAVQKLAKRVASGELSPDDISIELLSQSLDTAELPFPDLIIRTSGEKRLSGMMPFQGVYAELAFVDTLFPAFSKKEFNAIIDDFAARHRRFGAG
jgi:undecaprenyl diphosphate synthase